MTLQSRLGQLQQALDLLSDCAPSSQKSDDGFPGMSFPVTPQPCDPQNSTVDLIPDDDLADEEVEAFRHVVDSYNAPDPFAGQERMWLLEAGCYGLFVCLFNFGLRYLCVFLTKNALSWLAIGIGGFFSPLSVGIALLILMYQGFRAGRRGRIEFYGKLAAWHLVFSYLFQFALK